MEQGIAVLQEATQAGGHTLQLDYKRIGA